MRKQGDVDPVNGRLIKKKRSEPPHIGGGGKSSIETLERFSLGEKGVKKKRGPMFPSSGGALSAGKSQFTAGEKGRFSYRFWQRRENKKAPFHRAHEKEQPIVFHSLGKKGEGSVRLTKNF